MPLWGIGTNNEAKPKWLSDAEKERTFADDRGWVYKHPNGDEEVLVAIGNLSGTDASTGLGAPTVERIRVSSTTPSQGDMLTLYAFYNEPVAITGTPNVAVTADGGAEVMTYSVTDSDLDAGKVAFELDTTTYSGTVVVSADTDITLSGGTITDATDGSTAAELGLNNTIRTVTIQA